MTQICHQYDTKFNVILKSGDSDSSSFVSLFVWVGDLLVGGHGYSSCAFGTRIAKIYIFDIFHVLPKTFLEQNHLEFVASHDAVAMAL